MDKNEVIGSLKSSYTEKVQALEAIQAEGLKAIEELDAARKAGDAGLVSDASAKVDAVGADIKSANDAVQAIVEQLGWFNTEYPDAEDITKSNKEKTQAELKAMFNEITAGGGKGPIRKFTIGEHVANGLKYRGITSTEQLAERGTKFTFDLERGASTDEEKATKSAGGSVKDIKSIYSNYGEVFLDASNNPVPGFIGYNCGLVEDTSISCLLDPPEEDFEQCIQQLTLNGNRIRFTREASRVNNAASVLETIYNPYPDMEQDGTKPEGTFTLEDVTVRDVTIAEFMTASDRVLEDCGYIAQHIDHVLISDINREKRRQLINGAGPGAAGVPNQMLGILNQPGLLSRTHRDAGDGGEATDNIYDTFRRGLTDLWYQSASLDNICVIMNPRDGEIIDLMKDDLGRYLFNDSDCFNRNLRCLTIRYATDVPEGTAIMGNFNGNWQFYLRKALNVRVGLTGNQFIENAQTILAEMRGLSLVRCPRKILKVDGLA